MELKELNLLIDRITTIQKHLHTSESDPLLLESLYQDLDTLYSLYGPFLDDLLFDVYDEYCEDNQIQPIELYLTPQGVLVEADDFPGIKYYLKLKAFPLRFELENLQAGNHEVIWKAA